MKVQVRELSFVCLALILCVNGLHGQEIPPDDSDGQRRFDRVAKFAEVRNRSFDENLAAITTDDGGLGSWLVMGSMTNTLGWNDLFQPVFADPRVRRMHEQLAEMEYDTRQAALTKIVETIEQSLELMKTELIAAADDRITHGLRGLLLLLEEYDDSRFEPVVDHWLEFCEFIRAKYPVGSYIDENGKIVYRFVPSESIDKIFLYNIYFQKLVREKGKWEAVRQIDGHARTANVSAPLWSIKDLTWMDEGKDTRVFSVVLGSSGGGRKLTLNNQVGSELLKLLREDVAKLDSE